MKFDPCYEYFEQYKSACDQWVKATQELCDYQSECLSQGKVWRDVRYKELKKLSDDESAAKGRYFDSLHKWNDCKEGKI